jgi:hypothetical protein
MTNIKRVDTFETTERADDYRVGCGWCGESGCDKGSRCAAERDTERMLADIAAIDGVNPAVPCDPPCDTCPGCKLIAAFSAAHLEAAEIEAAAQLEADAHAAILVWCRSFTVPSCKPVMREIKGRCTVLDASYFHQHVIADGNSWLDCREQLRMNGWNV